MADLRGLGLAIPILAACSDASAQPPGDTVAAEPHPLPAITKLEVVGNHAGRLMNLEIDGKVVFEGRGHLDPPGVTWTHSVPFGGGPAPIELRIEPCEAPFKADMARDGGVHALIIQGCEIRLTP